MTIRQKRLLEEIPRSKTLTEAVAKAGYSTKRGASVVYEMRTRSKYAKELDRLTGKSLDTFEDVMDNSKVDIARVQAAKAVSEFGFGKPRSNDEKHTQLPPINITFSNTQ